MTEREMFEREYNKRFPHDKSTLLKSGNYSGWIKQASWQIWQASSNREGYKLVPVEPTLDMLEEAADEHVLRGASYAGIYKAMIGAAP